MAQAAKKKSSNLKKTKPSKTKPATTFTSNNNEDITPVKTSRSLKVKRSYIVVGLALLVIITAVYLGRNLIVAAMVNGQPISRLSVIRELEAQGGKQALDSLITKQLILQEARKKNIVISQKEVDDEMKRISENLKNQGQELDQVLTLQGMTKDQLVEQIKLQKMLEKMVGKIDVTDQEVTEYIESNRESLPIDQDEASIAANVKTTLTQQKLNEKAQTTLENLRKDARINYFVQY